MKNLPQDYQICQRQAKDAYLLAGQLSSIVLALNLGSNRNINHCIFFPLFSCKLVVVVVAAAAVVVVVVVVVQSASNL